MKTLISHLFEIAKTELPDARASLDETGLLMRFVWLSNDDPLRPSKQLRPLIVTIHEDFATSKFGKRPLSEIDVEFKVFICKVRLQFDKQTATHSEELVTPERWVFPPEC